MPSTSALPPYEDWKATCDTLHAHTQLLGKLAAAAAPPEPGFQHLALRLTARGWETAPLPAPDGSGAFAVALDLRTHDAVVEHSDGRGKRIPLGPNRAVGEVTRGVLEAVGPVEIDPTPQEVPWTVPLDEDDEHTTYDTGQVEAYFAAATRAALILAELRASYAGRSTPVNAWWGSFDVAVSLFADERELAVGWWPGDARYGRAAFYAYARPAPEGFEDADLSPPAARWSSDLDEFLLDWDEVVGGPDPRATGLEFARSALREAWGG